MLDQHSIVYNQPIVLNERQAGVAIEGVIRHNENRNDGGLLRLSVDTHGYTNAGMAVSKLLGFDLCPRLRNLSERKLYLPRRVAAPNGLVPIVAYEPPFIAVVLPFQTAFLKRISKLQRSSATDSLRF